MPSTTPTITRPLDLIHENWPVIEESRQSHLVDEVIHGLHVDIVGLGMHGSWTAIAIARLGVASVRLWDDDKVEVNNLETQAYGPADVGMSKTEALLLWLKAFGYKGKVDIKGRFNPLDMRPFTGEDMHPIVLSHVDSMSTRKDLASAALSSQSVMFVESRSMANVAFIHVFSPTIDMVDHYLATCFPEVNVDVACGATGTTAMGMQVAALVGSLLTLSKGGAQVDLLPNEHTITLGLGHEIKSFIPS